MKPAIIETVLSELVAEGRELVERVREAEQATEFRRFELGKHLLKARAQLPKRGSREDGWGHFLEAIALDEATAWRYMKLAEAVLADPAKFHVKGKLELPTYEQLGLTRREGAQPPDDLPDPRDEDQPREPAVERDEDGTQAAPAEPEIDRNTWCTPKEWAERLGSWDLDPCSNERSHIQAARELRLDERGEDGLFFASKFGPDTRAFINPPYAAGQVIQWVEAYAHTRFCFLLKFDPSTKWFAALMRHTGVVMIPRGERIEFEPPAGVPPEKAGGVQFPHAFFYAREEDVTEEMRRACFPAWRIDEPAAEPAAETTNEER